MTKCFYNCIKCKKIDCLVSPVSTYCINCCLTSGKTHEVCSKCKTFFQYLQTGFCRPCFNSQVPKECESCGDIDCLAKNVPMCELCHEGKYRGHACEKCYTLIKNPKEEYCFLCK